MLVCYFCLTSQFSRLYRIYKWVLAVTIISQSLAQHTAGTLSNFLTNMLNKSLTYSAPQFSHTQHHSLITNALLKQLIRLNTAYFAENWKYCSKIIFKCVNNTVEPIFNEKVTEKWYLLVHKQCTSALFMRWKSTKSALKKIIIKKRAKT